MKAFVLRESTFDLEYVPEPDCQPGFELIKVHATALNHRDQFIRDGLYSKIQLPAVLGSDICGELDGERVVIDPSMQWGDDPRAQGPQYNPIGMPSQGGLAEFVCVPKANIYPAPSHLTNEQAAALPLAGVTAWRAVFTRGQLQKHETVLITGIGGGVALHAMQFAVALGANVVVSSRSHEKIDRALSMGASSAFKVPHTMLKNSVDVIIDSIGGDTVNELTDMLRPGGRLVTYGSGKGAVPNMNMHRVFWKQLNIIGSTMGTPQDFSEMLAFVNKHKIVPVVDSVYRLADTAAAFDKLKNHDQFGKIVIQTQNA